MAHLHQHNFRNNQPCFLEGVGQKVKTVAQIATGLKQIYDITKAIAPIAATAAAVILQMKYPPISHTENIGLNNNNINHKLNEIGLNNAYKNANKIHVQGNTIFVAGTSDLKDVYDDITKIPFYGDIKNSTRYNQAKTVLDANPNINKIIGHSLGGSVALQFQKDNNKFDTITYSAPVLQLNPFVTGNRFRFQYDPISMLDNGAITVNKFNLNPHSYSNYELI